MSSWDAKLIEPALSGASTLARVYALFEQQRAAWDLFRDGESLLARLKTKTFSRGGASVIVQANPGRIVSTNARVDPASVSKRPCFLCPENLPPLERGISFGGYIMLPNPYPILKFHMTIASDKHGPQAIQGRVGDFLSLAKAVGPDLFVAYNGPRCGASAPDHMHFQACESAGVPLFNQLPADAEITPMSIWGRNLLACNFKDPDLATGRILKIIDALSVITGGREEPMMNMLALYRNGGYTVALFPRAKHRSACYFAAPDRRISVSPGAMEMAGIIVVADPGHFDRVTETVVDGIFSEVTLGQEQFARLSKAAA